MLVQPYRPSIRSLLKNGGYNSKQDQFHNSCCGSYGQDITQVASRIVFLEASSPAACAGNPANHRQHLPKRLSLTSSEALTLHRIRQ
ncbi:hypothetical protein WJX84_006564 [Apatococcus fuscideae]|uniref:Uncharacterized protein n=1 Tax=Apatococcus fuscideae TaxID=2026836 RepID=A0AAW1SZT4_9CHLO